MGTTSAQIERQITETRQHLDANLNVLERRAASGARRAVRIAVMAGVGLAAASIAGIVIYKLTRDQSPAARARDVARRGANVARKLRRRVPSVKVRFADSEEQRATSSWRSIAERVATTVAVSTAGALASRILKPRRGRSHS